MTKDNTNRLEISVPFTGFYNTSHGHNVERAIELHFDLDGDGEPDIPTDDLYEMIDIDEVEKAYCEAYLEMFEYDFGISGLTFERVKSPSYYNYSNDILMATIKLTEVKRLYQEVDKEVLANLIKRDYSDSCGFISHYTNKLSEWPSDVTEWDHNQLGTLVEAYVHEQSDTPTDQRLIVLDYGPMDFYETAMDYIPDELWDHINNPDKYYGLTTINGLMRLDGSDKDLNDGLRDDGFVFRVRDDGYDYIILDKDNDTYHIVHDKEKFIDLGSKKSMVLQTFNSIDALASGLDTDRESLSKVPIEQLAEKVSVGEIVLHKFTGTGVKCDHLYKVSYELDWLVRHGE